MSKNKEIKNEEVKNEEINIVKKETPEKPKKEKKSFNKRKFKYGSIATAITVVFVAAIVLLNILASQMTERFGLKLDVTKEQIFEVSDETIDYLKSLEQDVEISVMLDESTLESGNIYYKLVKEVTEKYSRNSDRITLNFYDTEKNPEVVTKYKNYYNASISTGDIVVFCDGRIKVLSMYDLYEKKFDYQTYQQSIGAIKAEQELTSAVMFVANPNPPKIAILDCQVSESVATSLQDLSTIFEKNGYTVETVDLLSQEITEDYSMIILPAPYTDLTKTAIEKIDQYLYNDGNLGKNLFYLSSFDQADTPELNAFLEEWGIGIGSGYVTNADKNSTVSVGIAGLGNYYTVTYANAGSDYTSFLSNEKIPLVMPFSRPLNLLFDAEDDRETSVILTTPDTSVVIDESVQTEEDLNSLEKSSKVVMARGSKHIYKDGEQVSSNVIVSGSVYFLDYYVTSVNSFSNQDFAINLINNYTGKSKGVTILSKSLELETLDMNEAEATVIRLITGLVIPLAVLVIGLAVYLRRRNR